MFTGVFKDRSPTRVTSFGAQAQLARVLQSKQLSSHCFVRNAEIGPFIVDYLCREQALILEVLPQGFSTAKQQGRSAFLMEMGFRLLQFAPQELTHPTRIFAQIKLALRTT
jgi:very-short-patch-repair endonuclease